MGNRLGVSKTIAVGVAAVLAVGWPQRSEAQSSIEDRLRALEETLSSQAEQLARQAEVIETQRQELELLQQMLVRGGGTALALPEGVTARTEPVDRMVPERAAVVAPRFEADDGVITDPAVRTSQVQPDGQAAAAGDAQALPDEADDVSDIVSIAEIGGVLTPRGSLTIEPSLEFSRSSVNRVEVAGFTVFPAINIGRFDISESDRNSFVAAVTSRFGITNRLEGEVKVPWNYRSDELTTRAIGVGADQDVTTETSNSALGDIEIAGRYQINSGTGGWPYFIGNLRFKSRTGLDPFEVDRDPVSGVELELPTGTGFYSLQPGVTVLVPSDPAVLFGSLNYTYNFERDVGNGFGTIDQGDSIGATFGMGVSLNETSSFTLGVDYGLFLPTKQNGEEIPGSEILQVGKLLLGYTYRLDDWVSLNFTVQTGITEEAPDVQFIFRVPTSWKLFD